MGGSQMKKINMLWTLLGAIIIGVFNIIIFSITKTYNATFWISYGFIHLAFVMVVISMISKTKVGKSISIKNVRITFSFLYFIVELILGTFFILFKDVDFQIALVPQIILAAIYGGFYILSLIAYESASADKEENTIPISKEL
jgi:hypothetical protein